MHGIDTKYVQGRHGVATTRVGILMKYVELRACQCMYIATMAFGTSALK